jgi:hypothetical protein
MAGLGWTSKLNSDESVRVAVRRMTNKAESFAWVR